MKLKKLYFIESLSYCIWLPVCFNRYSVKLLFFPTYYRTHSYYQATRLNIIQAYYYYYYLKYTSKWIQPIKIVRRPFFWWEYDK